MAVLKGRRVITANVCIDGQPVREYCSPKDESEENGDEQVPSCCNYIEAISGKRFTIRCKVEDDVPYRESFHITVEVFLDGEYAGNRVCRDPGAGGEQEIEGFQYFDGQSSHVVLHHYQFAEIVPEDTNDCERVARDDRIAEKLGVIRVVVSACRVLGFMNRVDEASVVDSSPLLLPHDELAKKVTVRRALSHRVSLKEKVTCPVERTLVKTDEEVELGVFIFKYRSRSTLQELMILPTGSSGSLPAEPDYDTMSREEAVAFLKSVYQQQGGTTRPKQEVEETTRGVFRQFSPSDTGIIDLTNDDVTYDDLT